MKLCTFILLLSVALCNSPIMVGSFEDPVMPDDTPKSGDLAAKTATNYTLDGLGKRWNIFTFGFMLEISTLSIAAEVGKGKVVCSTNPDHKVEVTLMNGIPHTQNNTLEDCAGLSTLTIENTSDLSAKYWVIVAKDDSTMYVASNDVPLIKSLPGKSLLEFVSFRGYISEDGPGSGGLDFVNITIQFDQYSPTIPRAFLGNGQRVTSKKTKDFSLSAPGVLMLQIHRNDEEWCTKCWKYFFVTTATAAQAPLYFSTVFHVDRGITVITPEFSGIIVVQNDTHGMDFLIDMRTAFFDADIGLSFKILNPTICTKPLQGLISMSSFDGKVRVVKQKQISGTNPVSLNILKTDFFYVVGSQYYLRVLSDPKATACVLNMILSQTTVRAPYVYLNKIITADTPSYRPAITYYRTYIPKEDFVNVISLTFRFTKIQYTWTEENIYDDLQNSTGDYCNGVDLYMGKTTTNLINNPNDKSTWTTHFYLDVVPEIDITFVEGMQGWCEDCMWGMSIYSTTLTHWAVTSYLTFVPFMIKPNVMKPGVIQPHTGGVVTYLYLYMKTLEKTVFTVKRVSEEDSEIMLYVSTTPNPTEQNYIWTDTTVGDGTATVKIDPSHPSFCNQCHYYIGIYFRYPETVNATNIEVNFSCTEGNCFSCDKDGLDPATQCSSCLPGYWGKDCTMCPNCGNGKCSDGMSGDGKCACLDGWGPAEKCTTCLKGYYGHKCNRCPSCNGKGTCLDGIDGSGKCACNPHWDQGVNCKDCVSGYYGKDCVDVCPGGEITACSNNGVCDSGVKGTGRCACYDEFVGLKCDTPLALDKCKPHCDKNHGGCDETKGTCVCWDGWKGKSCQTAPPNKWMVISIVVIVVLILIVLLIVFVLVYRPSAVANRFKKRQSNAKFSKYEDVLLSNVESQ